MKICCVKGCEKPVRARDMCNTHYARMRRGGNPNSQTPVQYHGLTNQERFEKRIEKDAVTGCWNWTASLNNSGYGQFNLTGARPIPAHRASWLIYKGEIPADPCGAYKTGYVCHTCDNPRCVNPDHLFIGNQQVNMDDKMGKGRHNYGTSEGTAHGMAKLNDDLVREIRSSPESLRELSVRLGIGKSTLHMVRKRITWKHVE